MAYDAFISYSHSADGLLAPAVQTGLQRLARPWYRRRALRIFRDETGLSVNPHLWGSIEKALDESRFFVLVASPTAAASPWVNREVDHWLTTKSPETILPVLTDGAFVWDATTGEFDAAASTALPPALLGAFADEPRFLDLRWARDETQLDVRHSRFRSQIADLAAPMHGIPKEDLEGEDVRLHRRALRLAWGGALALLLLTIAALVGAGAAVSYASTAHRNETRANRLATSLTDANGQLDVIRVRTVASQKQLDATRKKLDAAGKTLSDKAAELKDAGAQLTTANAAVTDKNDKLFEQSAALNDRNGMLTVANAALIGATEERQSAQKEAAQNQHDALVAQAAQIAADDKAQAAMDHANDADAEAQQAQSAAGAARIAGAAAQSAAQKARDAEEKARLATLSLSLADSSRAALSDGAVDQADVLAVQGARFADRAGGTAPSAARAALVNALQADPDLESYLQGLGEVVTDVTVSPDARLAAAAGSDGRVSVWSVSDDRLLGTVATGLAQARIAFTDPSTVVAMSDSRLTAFRSPDGGRTWSPAWSVPSDSNFVALASSARGLVAVDESPNVPLPGSRPGDGRFLMGPSVVKVFDGLGRLAGGPICLPGEVGAMAFSPGGQLLAVADGDDNGLPAVCGPTPPPPPTPLTPPTPPTGPTGLRVRLIGVDGTDHGIFAVAGAYDAIADLRFSNDGARVGLLQSGAEVPLHRWTVDSGQPDTQLTHDFLQQSVPDNPIALAADLDHVVQRTADGAHVAIGAVDEQTFLGNLDAPLGPSIALGAPLTGEYQAAFLPTGEFLTAGGDGGVPVFGPGDAASSRFAVHGGIDTPAAADVASGALSPDARVLIAPAVADGSTTAFVDDLERHVVHVVDVGGPVAHTPAGEADVWHPVAFGSTADDFAIAMADGSAQLRDARTGGARALLGGPIPCGSGPPPPVAGAVVPIAPGAISPPPGFTCTPDISFAGTTNDGVVMEAFAGHLRFWHLLRGQITATGDSILAGETGQVVKVRLATDGRHAVAQLFENPFQSVLHVLDVDANGWTDRGTLPVSAFQFDYVVHDVGPAGTRVTFNNGNALESYDLATRHLVWARSTTDVPMSTSADGTTLLLRSGPDGAGEVVLRAADTGALELSLHPVVPARPDASDPALVGEQGDHVVMVAAGVPLSPPAKVTDWSIATQDLTADACRQARRNLTTQEWAEFIGTAERPEATCDAKLPTP